MLLRCVPSSFSSSSSSSSQNKPPSSSSSIKSSHPHPSVSPNINVANLTVLPSSVSPSLKNQRLILPKPTAQLTAQSPLPSPNADIILSEGRQGRIKDVQTIIADYRSKNPANEGLQTPVPKIRGRRSSTNSSRGSSHSSGSGSGSGTTHQSGLEASRYSNPSLLSMANLALGSGAIVRQLQQALDTSSAYSYSLAYAYCRIRCYSTTASTDSSTAAASTATAASTASTGCTTQLFE
uniref:Uncharacterized protein n=1 Tax=Cacopsylla melanoneura TaxID=428564 RepID=A0A8D9ENP1_9HEMI